MTREAIRHDYLVARTQIEMEGKDGSLAPVFAYISELERQIAEVDPDLPRLHAIEEAAENAVRYHQLGRNPDSAFDVDEMLRRMDALDDAL